MKVALDNHAGVIIGAYTPGELSLVVPRQAVGTGGKQTVQHSVILTSATLHASWSPMHFGELEDAHFTALHELDVDVVLFGTGERLQFPKPGIVAGFYSRGIGFETMDTAAACRTFNILVAEGRRVAAALLIR